MEIAPDNITVFPSNDITVFPLSFDRESDPSARLLSETNLRKLVKGYFNTDSFIISNSLSDPFEFVLKGYYFSIKNIKSLIQKAYGSDDESSTKKGSIAHVSIQIRNIDTYETLQGSEYLPPETDTSTSSLECVTDIINITFSDSEEMVSTPKEDITTYSMPIAIKDNKDKTWSILPKYTRAELLKSEIGLITIDGGCID